MGGHASQVKQETKTSPSAEQVLSWVDQVFHELRQNKVRARLASFLLTFLQTSLIEQNYYYFEQKQK